MDRDGDREDLSDRPRKEKPIVESENLEETREIGTGLKGPKNSYTAGSNAENDFPMDTTRRREEAEERGEEGPQPGWEQTKKFLDPDSHS